MAKTHTLNPKIEMESSVVLQIKSLSKQFTSSSKQKITALEGIDLNVEQNEFICILGPSGCGKSTLLRIIAGLEYSTKGELKFCGVLEEKPDTKIGMVFQEYSLFPWLNICDNVAFGLHMKTLSRKKRYERSVEFLKLVEMENFAHIYPHELSGGMRQRVAIARALANNPELLLMDEPFGALDAHTRILLQERLLKLLEHHRKTILFVTHSVDEALFLADRIIIITQQPGTILKQIKIDMPYPRDRGDPQYGLLVSDLLNMMRNNC